MYKKRHSLLSMCLCLMDCVIAVASFILAGLLRYNTFARFERYVDIQNGAVIIALATVAFFYVLSVQDGFVTRGYLKEFNKVLTFNILVFTALAIYTFLTKNTVGFSRLTLGYFLLIDMALQYLAHIAAKHYARQGPSKRAVLNRHVLLVTSRQDAAQAIQRMNESKQWRYAIAGIVLVDEDAVDETIDEAPVVASLDNYLDFSTNHIVDEILITAGAFTPGSADLKRMVFNYEMMGIPVNLEIQTVETGLPDVKVLYRFGGFNVIGFSTRMYDSYLLLIKRVMDILGGVVGMLMAAVLFVLFAPCIVLESRGPVFFKQKRVGLNGRSFTVYKFRSMYMDAEERLESLQEKNEMKGPMFKIKDDPRITRVGRFMRKHSIDEFPQFFNVVKGDMSLVGTRPPTEREYKKYTHLQKKRLCFKPGITGMWQISGRNKIVDFDKVVEMDLSYIDNWSISLDIKILLKTVLVVLTGDGAA